MFDVYLHHWIVPRHLVLPINHKLELGANGHHDRGNIRGEDLAVSESAEDLRRGMGGQPYGPGGNGEAAVDLHHGCGSVLLRPIKSDNVFSAADQPAEVERSVGAGDAGLRWEGRKNTWLSTICTASCWVYLERARWKAWKAEQTIRRCSAKGSGPEALRRLLYDFICM